jgi:hypothetical protein
MIIACFVWALLSTSFVERTHIAQASIAVNTVTVAPVVANDERSEVVSRKRPKELTPLTSEQLLRTLREAHVVVFGTEPSRNRLAAGWAQVALENGRGKAVWNYNLGNVGPSSSEHFYYMHTRAVPYRAYNGYLEGGITYWRVVRKCGAVVQMFDRGEVRRASESLRRCNYYLADVTHYTGMMWSLYWHAIQRVFPSEAEEARRAGQN